MVVQINIYYHTVVLAYLRVANLSRVASSEKRKSRALKALASPPVVTEVTFQRSFNFTNLKAGLQQW